MWLSRDQLGRTPCPAAQYALNPVTALCTDVAVKIKGGIRGRVVWGLHYMLKFRRWHRTPSDVHFEEVLNET